MGRYLPDAIGSVLSQDYSGIEYVVADGGSDDGTAELLRTYGARFQWWSRPDRGAADALATAFNSARGEILGWLNADDTLLPGAVAAAVSAFEANPHAVAVFSGAFWIAENGTPIRRYPVAADADQQLNRECLICQPACFFRADAYRAAGGIDPTLNSAFDYDLWIRLARLGPMVYVPGCWAFSRMHANNKSLGDKRTMFNESIQVLTRHYGYVPFNWVYCREVHQRNGKDQFTEPLEPSIPAFLASLLSGLLLNPDHRTRYCREWTSHISWAGFKRPLGLSRET